MDERLMTDGNAQSRRRRRRGIENDLHANVLSRVVWQAKPYTGVKVTSEYDGETYQAIGFAKVQYPDKWNAEYGVELATNKAIAKIAKEIVNNDED